MPGAPNRFQPAHHSTTCCLPKKTQMVKNRSRQKKIPVFWTGVLWQMEDRFGYNRRRRRTKAARPTKPVPSRLNVPGSGVAVLGVVVAKQVGPVPHSALAT